MLQCEPTKKRKGKMKGKKNKIEQGIIFVVAFAKREMCEKKPKEMTHKQAERARRENVLSKCAAKRVK